MKQPRVNYSDAGRVLRHTLSRAHALKLPVRELRVLNAVLMLTASYSKLTDTTTTREVAELAHGRPVLGWERKKVWESLGRLDALGLVAVTRIGKGRGARLKLQLVPEAGHETSPRAGDVHHEKGPPISRGMSPGIAAHLEGPRRVSIREGAREGSIKHFKHDELVARLTGKLQSVGARVPAASELEQAVAHALTLVDWHVVDVTIGRAAESGRSWAYFKTALSSVRAS